MRNNSAFDHAIGANLDYGFQWELAQGETITVSSWVVPEGVEKSFEQVSENITSAFFKILLENVYVVTNNIETSGGRKDSRSLVLTCKKRFP